MALEAAIDAAQHGVGFAALDRQRADHRGVGAHDDAGRFRRDAAAPALGHQQIDIIAIALVALGIDQFEIPGCTDAQAETLKSHLHDFRATDQHRLAQAFLDYRLGGAQDAFVLAVAVDHAFA